MCFYANTFVNERDQAEDIASETFLKLWDRRIGFDNVKSIRSFLYTTVRNACIDAHRHEEYASAGRSEILLLTEKDFTENILSDLVRAELMRELHAVLKSLPLQCRRVVSMHFIQGKSFKEIAAELNLSVSTIKSQKARGLMLLKKRLSHFFFLLFF